ncbi:MAG: hypothetical protein HRU15_07535, partial [Planctomycetes bacterium]|nr:hypothetical protein [Planctomycetota bacterium]
ESLIELASETQLSTAEGQFTVYAYRNTLNGDVHLAFVHGSSLRPAVVCENAVTVRVQQASVLNDLQTSTSQVLPYLRQIADAGEGVFLYLRDASGDRILQQMAQSGATMHVDINASGMDPRLFGIGAQILHDIGVRRMRLITRSPRPIKALSGYEIEIIEHVQPNGESIGTDTVDY